MDTLICTVEVDNYLIECVEHDKNGYVESIRMRDSVDVTTMAEMTARFILESKGATAPLPRIGHDARHLFFNITKGYCVTSDRSDTVTKFAVYQKEDAETPSLAEAVFRALSEVKRDKKPRLISYSSVGTIKFPEDIVENMSNACYSPDKSVLESIVFSTDEDMEDIYDTMEDAFEQIHVIRKGNKIVFVPKINEDGVPLGVVTGKKLQTGTVKLTYCEYTEE